jgi:hypothetical protein
MMLGMPTPDQLQVHAIQRDVDFVGRFIGSLHHPGMSTRASSVSCFCMFPFLSLFVYESQARLSQVVPQVSGVVSNTAKEVVARSRHSLKLFDDTKRGLPGQLAYFRNDIEPAHRRVFLRPIPWPWAKDLGIYSYDGIPISTTHVATFAIGYEPRKLFTATSSVEIRSIAEEYGRYLASLGATADPQAVSFASRLDAARLTEEDYRSDRYYRSIFNGSGTPDVNALLNVFRVMVNFAAKVLPLDESPEAAQTIFKIRFLTLYHVLASLITLRSGERGNVTARSVAHLNIILDTADASLLTSPPIKPLRNTLMHYGLDQRINAAALSLQTPLYGLVSACLPSHDYTTFDATVSRQLELTAATMKRWEGTPGGRTRP